MKSFEYTEKRAFLGRLARGDDVLQGLTEFCKRSQVRVGHLEALGAVQRGGVGYYDHVSGVYRERRFDEGMEIASLVGNISQKDGDIFLHCHVILADRDGRCFGGHLLEGNITFACEFAVTDLEGNPPERSPDTSTGLDLW
jgi:predicted DNA-binding protein with PD1-like motif